MSIIANTLSSLSLGSAQTHAHLTLIPLIGETLGEVDYRLLDAALAQGCARVTEVSEAGVVPELQVHNQCADPILLLDGEELVGAKQNRILNLSVLVPAGRTTTIPVSCVEAGRWRADAAELRSAGRAHFAAGRARKSHKVSESLARRGSRESDQSEVWQDISEKAARMAVRSSTNAAAALYSAHEDRLQGYLDAFRPVEQQRGALFLLNQQVLSCDLFDAAETCAATLPKLVRSCALDALDAALETPEQEAVHPSAEQAAASFLSVLAATDVQVFPAVGLGEDLRISGDQVTGGALCTEERLIHLCAFPHAVSPVQRSRPSQMARASQRHRGHA